ncbi:unnamed protein product [Arabis nemorensis]|uniref:Uncharacterized protein n=1 Tax=Arabis nemorensis TaxID=586526 RepID=A0A565CDI9_9BRAS|nr:unnamed protein product [Arabis nemorensis]
MSFEVCFFLLICYPFASRGVEAIVKFAIVSNFDTRLRPLLRALRCDDWFDVVVVSAKVEAEKPNSIIFLKACEFLGVNLEDAVRVGDDHGELEMQVVTLGSEEVKLTLIWCKRHHVLKFFNIV